MYNQFHQTVLLFILLSFLVVSVFASQNNHKIRDRLTSHVDANITHTSHLFQTSNFQENNTSSTNLYSSWSPWSRCINCIQKRIKKCISTNCQDSRMYEERPCPKLRCKRRARHNARFHIVHLDTFTNLLTKQGSTDVYSKWSKWSACSHSCRTHRYRKCKHSGLCRKSHEQQHAYCYHMNSVCEEYVFELLEYNQHNQNALDYLNDKRYQYNNVANQKLSSKTKLSKKKCGIPNKSSKKSKMLKILGGTESEKNKWPWHVAIMNKNNEVFCGGTLIAPRWVLTASHCIRNFLRVRINAHYLRERNGPHDTTMTVFMMFPHPRFNMKTIENDIALLLLPKTTKTPVACLPNQKPKAGKLCSIMGWGKVRNTDRYGVDMLQEAKLPIVKYYTCKKSYADTLTHNMLCAGWYSGKSDTCAGDSGGGLMCTNKKTKSYSIQGITSFGDGCGKIKKFGIYTSVFNYLNWINNIIELYS